MSEEYPSVSIVMPVYNPNITYLKECIDSILCQTLDNFELIIIDDGSTNFSGIEFIRGYNDSRIHLIRNKHDFIESLNIGIRKAKGQYIARMDADDIMFPERLKVQFDYLELHRDIDICGSWMECFGTYSSVYRTKIDHADIITDLFTSNALFHPTIMMRVSSIQHRKNNLYDAEFIYAEDYRLWTRLIIDGLIFSNIPSVLLKYRLHIDQVTNKQKPEMVQAALHTRLDYIQMTIEVMILKNSLYEPLLDELVNGFNNDLLGLNDLSRIMQALRKAYNN